MVKVSTWLAGLDRVAMTVLRIGVLIVLLWIGGLKWFKYEADGITVQIGRASCRERV